MNSKPLIGITVESKHFPEDERSGGEIKLNWNYTEMVARAGGVPIILPPTADPDVIASLIDGWLIPGGLDIDAARFGEDNHPKVELQDPSRFEFESQLFDRVPNDLPILGICYGCQFLNVKAGGTLEQHIPDRTGSDEHSSGEVAEYTVTPGTKLETVLEGSAKGRSYHHQAVSKLAEGLVASAWHADGTIEAVESPSRPFLLGVQWHPERTPNDNGSRSLFRAFVEAADRYRCTKAAWIAGEIARNRIGLESAVRSGEMP